MSVDIYISGASLGDEKLERVREIVDESVWIAIKVLTGKKSEGSGLLRVVGGHVTEYRLNDVIVARVIAMSCPNRPEKKPTYPSAVSDIRGSRLFITGSYSENIIRSNMEKVLFHSVFCTWERSVVEIGPERVGTLNNMGVNLISVPELNSEGLQKLRKAIVDTIWHVEV